MTEGGTNDKLGEDYGNERFREWCTKNDNSSSILLQLLLMVGISMQSSVSIDEEENLCDALFMYSSIHFRKQETWK